MSSTLNLSDLAFSTKAEAMLVVNKDGILLDSYKSTDEDLFNFKYAVNISAMSKMILTMTDNLSEDVNIGKVKQTVIKSENGVFVANVMDNDIFLIAFSRDVSKVGVIMVTMDKLSN